MSDGGRPVAPVADLRVEHAPGHRDARGVLHVLDLTKLPFAPVRVFWITDVPADAVRGEHAHRRCSQYFVVGMGRVVVAAFDGRSTRELVLDTGDALLVPPGCYATLRFAGPGTLLFVICDRPYEAEDYLRTHAELSAYLAGTG